MNVPEELLTLTVTGRLLVCLLVPVCFVFVPFILGMVIQFLLSTWSLTDYFILGNWEDCLDLWAIGFNGIFLTMPAWIFIFFA